MKKLLLIISHLAFAAGGFALGIYLLPILTAPSAPTMEQVASAKQQAMFTGSFTRELEDSDFLHWGEGTISVGNNAITLEGKIAAGPDYKLYLSPTFVETEDAFKKAKSTMVRVGDVKTFENFVIPVTGGINPANYNTVVIWCEAFGEFITAAKYK